VIDNPLSGQRMHLFSLALCDVETQVAPMSCFQVSRLHKVSPRYSAVSKCFIGVPFRVKRLCSACLAKRSHADRKNLRSRTRGNIIKSFCNSSFIICKALNFSSKEFANSFAIPAYLIAQVPSDRRKGNFWRD